MAAGASTSTASSQVADAIAQIRTCRVPESWQPHTRRSRAGQEGRPSSSSYHGQPGRLLRHLILALDRTSLPHASAVIGGSTSSKWIGRRLMGVLTDLMLAATTTRPPSPHRPARHDGPTLDAKATTPSR